MSEIPKAYEPQAVEEKWYAFWLKQNCFVANPASTKPPYSIVIPPPNVTGMLHMGHVLNNTIQDILARKARMDGKEVLWLPGTDHAGIATQVQVERALKKEEKKTKHDLGREEFLKRVWAWKEKHGGIIIQQLKKLGASCDWTRERFTMDPEYSKCVQKVFVELYKKGLIYRGKRMVNWCPASLTALSDEEVVMKEQKGSLYYFKVEVVDATPSSHNVAATPSSPAVASEAASGGARATLCDDDVAIRVKFDADFFKAEDSLFLHQIVSGLNQLIQGRNQNALSHSRIFAKKVIQGLGAVRGDSGLTHGSGCVGDGMIEQDAFQPEDILILQRSDELPSLADPHLAA